MADNVNVEYEFQVKDIDVEIQAIEAQIARLNLDKEKLNYQKIMISHSYNEYKRAIEAEIEPEQMSENQSVNFTYSAPEMEVTSFGDPVELKPRRLKK